MKNRGHSFHFALVALLMLACTAGAQTKYYVDALNGDDANTGNQGHPKKTIQAAINIAGSGSWIYVATGTYTGTNINVNKSVLLWGQGSPVVVIPDSSEVNGFDITANSVTIRNLEIVGPVAQPYTTYAWGSNISCGIRVAQGVKSFSILSNNIHNVRNGILIDGRGSTSGNIGFNTIENTRSGISIQYTDDNLITITNNVQGPVGNEWGVNLHLNGTWDGTVVHPYPYPGGAAPSGVQQKLKNNSVANAGWTVQDSAYTSCSRTQAQVAVTGVPAAAGSVLTPISTVQGGVDAVVSGGQVSVAAGTYAEQISINKSISLVGAGKGLTTILSPAILTPSFTPSGGATKKAIVFAHDTANVVVRNLTVDGAGRGNGNYQFVGIAFYRAGGTIDSVEIKGMRETPASGTQHGVGFYACNDSGAVRNVTVSNSNIHDYQKGGIVFNEAKTVGLATGNLLQGLGPVPYIAQNGIQFGFGATGSATSNTVTGNVWTGTYGGSNDPVSDLNSDGSAGILAYMPGSNMTIANNTLVGNQLGITVVAASGAMTGVSIQSNSITGLAHTGYAYPVGIGVWSSDQWTPAFGGNETATSATIQNNTITNHDYGVINFDYTPGGAVPHVSLHGNAINNSRLFGAWTNSATDASGNWWGRTSGPSHITNPRGRGDSISNSITYSPWWNRSFIIVSHPWAWSANDSLQATIAKLGNGDTLYYLGPYSGKFKSTKSVIVRFAAPLVIDSLVVDSSDVLLSSDLKVSGLLQLGNGNILTGDTNKITLDTTAIGPTETSKGKIIGTVVVTPRNVGKNSLQMLGLYIQPGNDNLGNVGFTRKTGTLGIVTAGAAAGIASTWEITVDHQPASGRTVTFSWLRDFDNKVDTTSVTVFRNEGSGWLPYAGPYNVSNQSPRQVTVTVNGFSQWTIGSSNTPLPVQAVSFAAKSADNNVTLSWKTESEVSNAGFNVLRQDPGATSFKLIADWSNNVSLKGLGSSGSGRDYCFVDSKVGAGGAYSYRIQSVSLNGLTKDVATISVTVDVPGSYALYQNYPNPFNPTTTIRFDLKQTATIALDVYNMVGEKVLAKDYNTMNAGRYEKVLDMGAFSSGVYFYRIAINGVNGERFVSTKRLVLLK